MVLAVRSLKVSVPRTTQPCAMRTVQRAVRPVAVRAAPAKEQNVVETAIKEAEDACKDGSTGECAAAWDNVEEISASNSDNRQKKKESVVDPMEQFCAGDPSADECRVYED